MACASGAGGALDISPRLPAECVTLDAPVERMAPAARVRQWQVRCERGLSGGERITFDGLAASMVDALVRVERADGSAESLIARPRAPVVTLGIEAEHIDATGYFALGVEHIAGGPDHLLFVLCLVLLVRGIAPLLKTITAFTLAHSITLALATLGVIHVPQAPVEATIALSILFLARELMRPAEGGAARRWPWLVAFGFGLLHGLGFAGALSEVGLPADAVPLALLLFNLGIEAGQLLFVAAVLAVWLTLRHVRWPRWSLLLPAYAAGSISGFWWLQRMVAVIAH